MFTGIIEEVGTIRRITGGAQSSVLTIACKTITDDLHVGDSIAVNGVCLTVTRFDSNGFTADVMHETLKRSSLAFAQSGSRVNLERAMPADGRFGGHMVSGHIDGMGTITNISRDDIAIWYTIETPESIMKYIVEKGSIAIDGTSLTVASCADRTFSVSIIPHTVSGTIFADKSVGDTVNLENDMVGKYVGKLLQEFLEEGAEATPKTGLTMEFLERAGF